MNETKPMNLSKDEKTLLGMLKPKGYTFSLITRNTERPFDLSLEGEMTQGVHCRFGAWLPLTCIRELTTWTRHEIAGMSDYSEMVRGGDWSGIRDSSPEAIWAIFEKFVLPLISTAVPKGTVYTIKSVKTFRGTEGEGFWCVLYRDKKKIGSVTDTADGGEIHFFLDKGEKEILDLFCMQLPHESVENEEAWVKAIYPNGREVDADAYLCRLVDEYLHTKRLKRLCSKKTLFLLKDEKDPNCMRTVLVPFSPKVADHLRKKYGDNLKEIINERFAE